ncbi:MAG: DUF5615 family PIN-like protein [Anaerolineales bacterium]|nr:DUF5615 family PIN-like protein [Anaerolineales bacterium]
MLKFVADENFNNNILRGIWQRNTAVDIVRIQDVGLSGADDPTVLAWAAKHGRVLLTHDVATITNYAYERIKGGERMPGVFEVNRRIPLAVVIESFRHSCLHGGFGSWLRGQSRLWWGLGYGFARCASGRRWSIWG